MPRLIDIFRSKQGETLEPGLLFAVFFLPGYLFQAAEIDPGIFDSPLFHALYLIQTIPLILLLLFILSRKGSHWWVPYHLKIFKPADSLRGLLTALFIWVALLPFFFVTGLIFPELAEKAAGIPWKISSPAILPLVALTSLITGYWEELFFRAYLDGQLRRQGVSANSAAAAGIMLFAAGHIYQGLIAASGTGIIGACLLYVFRRTRNIHAVAIGHGIYNFSVLSLTLLVDFG